MSYYDKDEIYHPDGHYEKINEKSQEIYYHMYKNLEDEMLETTSVHEDHESNKPN